MKKYLIKKTIFGLVLAFIFTALLPMQISRSDNTQQQLDDVNRQIDQQQNYLNQVKSKEKSILGQIQTLDKDAHQTESDLATATTNINSLKGSIKQTEAEINLKQLELTKKSDLLGQRLVFMYEDGSVSYLEVLLSANSIKDFLTRYDMLKSIVDQDVQLIDSINQERQDLTFTKSNMETKVKELETVQATYQQKQQDLSIQKTSKKSLLNDIDAQKDQLEEAMNELEQTSRDLEQLIRSKEAGSTGSVKGTGSLTWPVPGYTEITSPYGMRFHPILKVRKMHTGVDIAVPGGTNILAADGGTVILAAWTTGDGKTTIVDHGNGTSTLYAHQQEWLVSEGDTVKKGQVIGKVDSTGWSTGNHLHFEVRINGTPTNPMGYF